MINEGVKPNNIYVIGSPIAEVYMGLKQKYRNRKILKKLKIKSKNFFLASIHREENVDKKNSLKILVNIFNKISEKYKLPIIVSTHPRTRLRLKSEKLFELNLVDVEKDVLDSQNIEGSVEFEINTKVFDKYVSEMILFGENMEFVCYQENIYMKSYGDEGMYTLKLPHDSMEELIVEDDLKLKTKVSLKYLSYITKIHPVFNTITMKVRPDAPIQVDILDEYIEVRYYIAPKISDHDEEEDEDAGSANALGGSVEDT